MALKEKAGLRLSTLDPANIEKLWEELSAIEVTDYCLRNNRVAPTVKRVVVSMWTKDGSNLSFADDYLAAGDWRKTELQTLDIQVEKFEIRWRILSIATPVWHSTGIITAAPGTFFSMFGIRWNEHDAFHLILPY